MAFEISVQLTSGPQRVVPLDRFITKVTVRTTGLRQLQSCHPWGDEHSAGSEAKASEIKVWATVRVDAWNHTW